MKFEVISKGKGELYNEICPTCKQKHFLDFIGEGRITGYYKMVFVPVVKEKADFVECQLCKAVYKVPKSLRVRESWHYEKLYNEQKLKPVVVKR